MNDINVRKLVLFKTVYTRYCSKCPFCIKADWNKNKGVKYGVIDVLCCKNGGKCKDSINNVCPHGIAWNICLGEESISFNPEDWKLDRFSGYPKPEETIEEKLNELEEEAIRKKKSRRSKYKQRRF